jgi:hypothetical protein
MKSYEIETSLCSKRIQDAKEILKQIAEDPTFSASLSSINYYTPEVEYLRALKKELEMF